MNNEEREKYLQAYYDNEADANKHMSIANAAAAVYMTGIWILYLAGVFKIHSNITLVLINISFPLGIILLLSPLLYVFKFKHFLRKPHYKHFALFSFVFVIAVLNLILPKHSAIAWALCIIMTNHYYNTKTGLVIFISVVVASLLSMFGSMFVGEFDANLILGNEVLEKAPDLYAQGEILYANGPAARYELLKRLIDLGYNRLLDSLTLYFLPRTVILVLVYSVSHALNKRTYKLLVKEINFNSEQEKAKTELEVAKEIQLATLPSNLVISEDVEIVGELKAAKGVGGDFYDYFQMDDNHVAFLIGDVSGKGIPAAMFMMKTITCFKNFTRIGKTPSEILKEVNRSIYDNNSSQMFVTCFLAILDITNGHLAYANAGHNPPVIGTNGNYRYLRCNTGFVLGGLEEAFVKDEELTLQPGETFTVYTDGITEARNNKGEFFGEERLIQTFNAKEYTCLVELHHSIKDQVMKFVNGAPQSDDMAYVTIKYHGDRYNYAEKFYNGVIDEIPKMIDFTKSFCEKHEIPREFVNNLCVVCDEITSNIVNYGYENKGGDIFMRQLYNKDKKEYVLTVIDRAPAFNPLDVDNPMVSGDAENQRIGGLGILIVKKIMTEYAYDWINNKNILVLKKRF